MRMLAQISWSQQCRWFLFQRLCTSMEEGANQPRGESAVHSAEEPVAAARAWSCSENAALSGDAAATSLATTEPRADSVERGATRRLDAADELKEAAWQKHLSTLANLLQKSKEHQDCDALGSQALPVDFQLQLQLLQCMVQQRAFLQQMSERMQLVLSHLEVCKLESARHKENAEQQMHQTAGVDQRIESIRMCLEQVCEKLFFQQVPMPTVFGNNGSRSAHQLAKPVASYAPETIPIGLSQIDIETPFLSNSTTPMAKGHYETPPRFCNSITPMAKGVPTERQSSKDDTGPAKRLDGATTCGRSSPKLKAGKSLYSTSSDDTKQGSITATHSVTSGNSAQSKAAANSGLFGLADKGQRLSRDAVQAAKNVIDVRLGSELPEDTWLRSMVKSPGFDLTCAGVIVLNAIVFGVRAQLRIDWAIDNVGHDAPSTGLLFILDLLNYVFLAFYTMEILLKLFVLRRMFFLGSMRIWNLFDLALVFSGLVDLLLYDVVNVSFLRTLRLVRMLKMLRVVRVMRFFRVLRMMLGSIAGSMMTLFWSIVLLSLVMYIFGLCFLQSISAYLMETPPDQVDETDLESIKIYWCSVSQALYTLYYAVTGGADWEPIAIPLRACGEFYFLFFCFYVAFTALAVLNVLTGMIVECTTNIAKQDEDIVGAELLVSAGTEEFRQFFLNKRSESLLDGDFFVSWVELENSMDCPEPQKFLSMAEITKRDVLRVFNMLDTEHTGFVELEDFIRSCLAAKGGTRHIDLVYIMAETRRLTHQHAHMMHYVEESFDAIKESIDGRTPLAVKSLEDRLKDAKCLPLEWHLDIVASSKPERTVSKSRPLKRMSSWIPSARYD